MKIIEVKFLLYDENSIISDNKKDIINKSYNSYYYYLTLTTEK